MELQADGTTLHESECGGSAVCEFVFVHGWMFTNDACPSPWGVTLLRPAAPIPTGWEGIPLAWAGGAGAWMKCAVLQAGTAGCHSMHESWETQSTPMLSYTITFLIIALIAGALGFGGVAGTATWIAHVCFVVFLVLFLISLVSGRRPPVV